MNTNKHSSTKVETPNSKLQKSSVIFMQLGLIVALFAVYLALEYKTIKKSYVFAEPKVSKLVDEYVPDQINVVDPQKKIIKRVVKTKQVKIVKPTLDKVNVIDNNQVVTEKLPIDIITGEDDPKDAQQLALNDIPSVEAPPEDPNVDVDFVKVEIKPTFYKCENKKGEAQKACFNKMMSKYVNKYFNSDIGQDLGLSEGIHRIWVQFVIDKNGDIINVKSNATQPRLKKEAERVVKRLPKMIPGKQRNHYVNVKYNLPINFNVTY